MGVTDKCSKCGATALRHSRWRPKDGLLRSLFFSAVRCQACQYRQYRFSPWATTVTVAAVLSIAFVAGVIYAVAL
jgi:predicted nucleic-acid-binding Zn-ribbon protein